MTTVILCLWRAKAQEAIELKVLLKNISVGAIRQNRELGRT